MQGDEQEAPRELRAAGAGRFFHTVVLLGTSLAASCGGRTSDDGALEGSGGAQNSGGGAHSSGGASVGSGAASSGGASSGGAVAAGGASPYDGWGLGGELSLGGGSSCPPEQWDCSAGELLGCSPVTGWRGCSCNDERPAEAEDCALGLTLVCLPGEDPATGERFRFSCECIASADACRDECSQRTDHPSDLEGGYVECWEDEDAILCGCELTILR
jgi:hypothetical protein